MVDTFLSEEVLRQVHPALAEGLSRDPAVRRDWRAMDGGGELGFPGRWGIPGGSVRIVSCQPPLRTTMPKGIVRGNYEDV